MWVSEHILDRVKHTVRDPGPSKLIAPRGKLKQTREACVSGTVIWVWHTKRHEGRPGTKCRLDNATSPNDTREAGGRPAPKAPSRALTGQPASQRGALRLTTDLTRLALGGWGRWPVGGRWGPLTGGQWAFVKGGNGGLTRQGDVLAQGRSCNLPSKRGLIPWNFKCSQHNEVTKVFIRSDPSK